MDAKRRRFFGVKFTKRALPPLAALCAFILLGFATNRLGAAGLDGTAMTAAGTLCYAGLIVSLGALFGSIGLSFKPPWPVAAPLAFIGLYMALLRIVIDVDWSYPSWIEVLLLLGAMLAYTAAGLAIGAAIERGLRQKDDA